MRTPASTAAGSARFPGSAGTVFAVASPGFGRAGGWRCAGGFGRGFARGSFDAGAAGFSRRAGAAAASLVRFLGVATIAWSIPPGSDTVKRADGDNSLPERYLSLIAAAG